jgi:hypothetical protein
MMRTIMLPLKISPGVIGAVAPVKGLVSFAIPGGMKGRIFAGQIARISVSTARLANPKTPQDYGLACSSTNIITPASVRLSASEPSA